MMENIGGNAHDLRTTRALGDLPTCGAQHAVRLGSLTAKGRRFEAIPKVIRKEASGREDGEERSWVLP